MSLGLVGRKSRDMLARRGLPVRFEHVNLPKVISFAEAEAIAAPAVQDFIEGRVDSVYLIYNEFKSVMQQRVVVEQLLPLPAVESAEAAAAPRTDYLYEPSAERIFEVLLKQLVEAQILRALVGIERRVLRRADDRDGRRDAQLGGHDREPDAVHEQDPPGGDHARDHRSRVRRASALKWTRPAQG